MSTGIFHADVVVQGETAYVFCFAHPGRVAPVNGDDGTLRCDRDDPVRLDLRAEQPHFGAAGVLGTGLVGRRRCCDTGLGAGAVGETLDVVPERRPG
ncbi:hypothetical protein ABZ835_19220 [Streptomyces sp. NPDC047461]|uniref:hypothetical protein n=1 Tax=Streptomyces sp. NPDC047461 TaxID=3155619 RepID=UPI00340A5525